MFFPVTNIRIIIMGLQKNEGFFCVVYLKNEKKTVWYKKYWRPSKLANYLTDNGKPWLWVKIYINKDDYFNNTKGTNYHAIFDADNPVTDFTFQPFRKN